MVESELLCEARCLPRPHVRAIMSHHPSERWKEFDTNDPCSVRSDEIALEIEGADHFHGGTHENASSRRCSIEKARLGIHLGY
jgi:hypothetical protein